MTQIDVRGPASPDIGASSAQPEVGLTSAEAAEILQRVGPNEIETGHRFRLVREGLGLLTNPLVLILLAASVISGVLGEAVDAVIIIVIVLLSVALDFYQVFSSQHRVAGDPDAGNLRDPYGRQPLQESTEHAPADHGLWWRAGRNRCG